MFTVDLECENGHGFEGWYSNGAEYDQIVANDELTCPLCNTHQVRNTLMTGAPKTSKTAAKQEREQARVYLHEYQGRNFTDKAIAMHRGDEPAAPIWGMVTPDEQKRLDEEGVPTGPVDEIAVVPDPDPTEVN